MATGKVTRRRFVEGASLGVGAMAAAMGGHALALASESTEAASTFADTIAWDAEYDVVVLGMGMAGMSAALAAAGMGAETLLCEKAPEGGAGGNSKVCMQFFIYGNEDEDATRSYLSALAGGRSLPADVLDTMVAGVAHLWPNLCDRYGFDPEGCMDFNKVPGFYLAPEYPEFAGGEKVSFMTAHQGMGDSFIYQTLKGLVAQNPSIDVWYESPGVELVQDPVSRAVIGVVVARGGGRRTVRALNGVCVCTGGFEDNPEMVQDYLDVVNYAVCGGAYNEGDGIKMCQKVGAKLWHMASYERDCQSGHAAVSFDVPWGQRCNMVKVGDNKELLAGAVMLVGGWGNRFVDESARTRHGHMSDGNGIWENPRFPERVWLVWDETQNGLIEGAGLIPAAFADTVVSCATLPELAAAIEVPEESLAKTVEDFDYFASTGCDWEFGRDPETMRPFDGAGYYAIRVKNAILNTQGGPERNGQAQVLDIDGNPIPHLYSAGEMGGFTTCMYQGGANTAECYIFGHLAGENAAAPKDPLPPYTAAPVVESAPQHLGDENDLEMPESLQGVGEDGLLLGTSETGMGGLVSVAVGLDADGKIAQVEVTRHSETEGIGTKAIDAMPERFVGLATAEEIDAVDAVAGATVTSKALKAAVKTALGL